MIPCPCCQEPLTRAERLPVIRSRYRYGDRVCVPCGQDVPRELTQAVDEDGATWPPCPTHAEQAGRT
jgi:hypothetical protein